MSIKKEALDLHRNYEGKLEMNAKVPVETQKDLSLAYSPGVAEPCKHIHQQPEDVYTYTNKGNMVAVVSNGSAVLGLGDIGPEASLPVMEGKSILFKRFANIDAVPLCLNLDSPEDIIQTIQAVEPSFGGINLEDIGAPDCFEIEEALKQSMNIPVFHDDQHGTAIVTLAGVLNAAKLVDKPIETLNVVINGAGSAGVAVANLLLSVGVADIIMCDSTGILSTTRHSRMTKTKKIMAEKTNKQNIEGSLQDAVPNADVLIGVSQGGAFTEEMIQKMNQNPIIFAMANPDPEIWPEDAKRAGATVIGTGRSDQMNQVNNVLAFPGVFRGALDSRATTINEKMKIAAAEAIADLIGEEERTSDYIIPPPFDARVGEVVAAAVSQAAVESGVGRPVSSSSSTMSELV
ncbi:NAD(P)-dependent malic enzyme [Salsuginibacillus kocurii]|uniref:NAD(P)-dependent malic enzyme n=1 Tax=Salsuginibacillus kocurii TaxID=427078 RepID=UPI0003671E96|nr:malic enzyme-like NAD(P)-binding protein [Salsuginibacillus kocurii]